jgi:hypothetical protein
MTDESSVQGRRSHDHDDVLAQAVNLLIARGAYRDAARIYPKDMIELRQVAHNHRARQVDHDAGRFFS